MSERKRGVLVQESFRCNKIVLYTIENWDSEYSFGLLENKEPDTVVLRDCYYFEQRTIPKILPEWGLPQKFSHIQRHLLNLCENKYWRVLMHLYNCGLPEQISRSKFDLAQWDAPIEYFLLVLILRMNQGAPFREFLSRFDRRLLQPQRLRLHFFWSMKTKHWSLSYRRIVRYYIYIFFLKITFIWIS